MAGTGKKNEPSILTFFSDVGIYSAANTILILTGILQTFVFPKFLSIEDFGYWRLFILYVGYTGILHFGFVDGIFIRWLNKGNVNADNEISKSITLLFFQQLIITITLATFLVIIGLDTKYTQILLFVLFYSIAGNITSLIFAFLQVRRHFRELSLLTILQQLGTIVCIVIIFSFNYIDYLSMILGQLIACMLVLILSLFFIKKYLVDSLLDFSTMRIYWCKGTKTGFFVLLGNFVSLMYFSADRFLVSIIFSVQEFAYYSFAASVLSMVYLGISTVSKVVLPYISILGDELKQKVFNWTLDFIIILWGIGLGLYFFVEAFVIYYLPYYIPSLIILKVLLCFSVFGGVINLLHNNYFKVHAMIKEYFTLSAISLLGLFIFFLIARLTGNTILHVATASGVGLVIWFMVSERKLSIITGRKMITLIYKIIFIMLIGISFLIASLCNALWAQLAVYYAMLIIILIFFVKTSVDKMFLDKVLTYARLSRR